MEKDRFLDKAEFTRFDPIVEASYVLNLIALIITMIFCLILFRIN